MVWRLIPDRLPHSESESVTPAAVIHRVFFRFAAWSAGSAQRTFVLVRKLLFTRLTHVMNSLSGILCFAWLHVEQHDTQFLIK